MGDPPHDQAQSASDAGTFAQAELVAMLGHELRNPLAPIRNSAALLRTLCTDPRQLQAVEIISRNVVHLTRMLDDLLDGTRLRRGSFSLTKQWVDIANLVHDVLENITPSIESRRQNLHVSLPASPVQMHGDPVRLAQILTNLLNNANRYTPEGGSISFVASATAQELMIEVIDDGAGIDPAVLPLLFNMFAQAPQALDRAQGGLGLGLAISRNLAEMHGGTLEAASAGLGHGSRFTLRIPLVSEPYGRSRPATEALPVKLGAPFSARVLIIEDNEDIATTLALALSESGFSTMTAHSGEHGLEIVEQFMPDAVVLDIGLPGLNGFEVGQRIRQIQRQIPIVVLAISGYSRDTFLEKKIGAQFDHYLVKPVDPDTVSSLIAASLGRARSA
jgi:CheY-like chemotaxis protein